MRRTPLPSARAWFVSAVIASAVIMLLLITESLGVSQTLAQETPAPQPTLTQRLVQEDPAKLVLQAREVGDIVRGAILFHQGNINCVKCHRRIAADQNVGPDLGRIDPAMPEASIVESILQPSKVIKKGYETVAVLTVEGRVVTGMVVRQDDEAIVLRTSQDVNRPLTISRANIDAIRPSTTSNMPSGLIDQLKDYQQFLDLLRYVLNLKDQGSSADSQQAESSADAATRAKRELSSELNGRVLVNQLNCVACHELDGLASSLPPKQAPDLNWSAKWLNPRYLIDFVSNPHKTKPGSSMPHVLGSVNPQAREETAEAIVHFLTSINENQYESKSVGDVDSDAIRNGYEVFHSVGCVACHAPRDEAAVEMPLESSVPLGKLSGKYDAKALTAFLEDPHVVRPSGRMPNMQLTHREAFNIAEYLLQPSGGPATDLIRAWKTDATLADKGKRLFSQSSCNRCHTSVTNDRKDDAKSFTLKAMDLDKGCLSTSPGIWPDFYLSKRDRNDIRTALEQRSHRLSDEQQIDVTLTAMNCIACHERDQLGGIPADRNHHFQTTNLNLGDQGRVPPMLTGVGAKLKPKWMREVLVNGRAIRPYMKTRMPQYGKENVGHLVELFQAVDELSPIEFATFKDQKKTRELGLEIAGNKGLNCVACHTYQYKLSDTMPAVDLTEMAERLKKDWFYQYMLDPQRFSPNTVMPSFWPSGQAIRPDIAGNPRDQIESLWQYLLDGRQARTPRGVVREPLEIVVKDEARMLRRSYPGIGKRGIGVGYPGGVNLAFDAEQMRLATLWKGRFVDPSGVWYGQGHGRVRLLGRPIEFLKGPELDDATNPWRVSEGRPPSHQFHGYDLDEQRRPTFRYSLGSIQVQDHFREVIDAESGKVRLRRHVKLDSNTRRNELRFRVASLQGDDGDKKSGPSIELSENNQYLITDRLRIQIVSGPPATIDDSGTKLQVPLTFQPNQSHELVLDYSWE